MPSRCGARRLPERPERALLLRGGPSAPDHAGSHPARDRRVGRERHPYHIRIHVPLAGTDRGLRNRAITFDIGHSNGVGVTTLAFAASVRAVEAVIGPDVARMMRTFSTDALEAPLGLSARIVPAGEGAALVFDTST